MIHGISACRSTLCGLVIALAVTLAACGGPWRDIYFKQGVDRLTQDEVREKLGPPHTAKTPALGGDSIWTYRVPMGDKGLRHLHGPARIPGKLTDISPIQIQRRKSFRITIVGGGTLGGHPYAFRIDHG